MGAALCSLATCTPDHKETIARLSGTKLIVESMLEHFADAQVQEYGCRALRSALPNSTNQTLLGDAGGIDAVLKAMSVHESVVAVQHHGCWALSNIAFNHPG